MPKKAQSALPKKNADNTSDSSLQKINQEIYKRNLELAVVNKTLSLLRKLYQISLLALKPEPLSEKISQTILVDLNMDLAGIFLFDGEKDVLTPLKFARSKKFEAASSKPSQAFLASPIEKVKTLKVLNNVISKKTNILNAELGDIWSSVSDKKTLHEISASAHLNTVLIYPLVTQNRIIGILVLGINRDYKTLGVHEQDSITSLVDVVAVALDNTLLYEKQEATNQQLVIMDKARAEFISIASHQLRTPPATIKWYLAAILDGDFGKLEKEAKAGIEKAQLVNNRLISLIDDMLNASRIERGKMEFLFESTDISKLTDDIILGLTPQATMKKLQLVYKKTDTKLPRILADKEKLQQVINNLVDNAIKYTKEGKVTVELTKNAAELIWKVKDTGKGMSVQDQNNLFQKYSRSKDSNKHAQGLGLGLYVADVIVKQHKGKIWAESRGVGKGSTFFVSLPIKTDLKAEVFDFTKNQGI